MTWIALLRGINVGTAKRIAMADLRAMVEDAGFARARTLLNSGNVVFEGPDTASAMSIAATLEAALERRAGFRAHIVVIDAPTLDAIVAGCTLGTLADNPSRLLVGFLQDSSRLALLTGQAAADWTPEALAVGRHAVYVWAPNGVVESRALEAVGRTLGPVVTTRNWATTLKVQAACRPATR